MTFLELHNQIQQTRKARKGIGNRTDYFAGDEEAEQFYSAVYKRAVSVANQIVKHYEEKAEFNPKDKPTISWKE